MLEKQICLNMFIAIPLRNGSSCRAGGRWQWLEENVELRRVVYLFIFNIKDLNTVWQKQRILNGGEFQLIQVSKKSWDLELLRGPGLTQLSLWSKRLHKKDGCQPGKQAQESLQDSRLVALVFVLFLSLTEIIIQHGIATRRDPNGEPRQR